MTAPARQDRPQETPSAGRPSAAELQAANINPHTGLATDYLNHFNEAIMLLDMIPDMPECADDFLAWRARSYREHFAASGFTARELAILAYEQSDAVIRAEFDAITDAMNAILTAVGAAMREARHDRTRIKLAEQAAGWLRPLAALAGGVIHGSRGAAEADIDSIMTQELP